MRHRCAAVTGLFLVAALLFVLRPDQTAAQTFVTGTFARISADGDCLRMRAGASSSAAVITCLPDGSLVTIRDGSQSSDGLTWQFIEADSNFGWVAAMYLDPLSSGPTATPTSTPAATETPGPTPSPTSTVPPASGGLTGALPSAGGLAIVVWGGGSVTALQADASGRGCNAESVWSTSGGAFVGYLYGVPAIVNQAWNALHPNGPPAQSALILVCEKPGGSVPSTSRPPSSNPPVAGTPPGPAGNE